MQVYKIGVLWKKVLTKRYKNIVYCVHIEIENAVRCTRKEQWSRNEFDGFTAFFCEILPQLSPLLLCSRIVKEEITYVICPEGMVRDGSYVHGVFTENYRLKKEKMYAKK